VPLVKFAVSTVTVPWRRIGSGGIAPRVLDLGTRRWVVSFTSWPLYHRGKSPEYPLDRRLGESQSRSWGGGEEENSQPAPRGNRTPPPQSRSSSHPLYGLRWGWVVNFTPRPLYPQGRSPWYPLDRRLGGRRRKIPSPRRESNSRTPIVQPVAQRYTNWAIMALLKYKYK
jgi:hypothetical protein